MFDTMQIDIIKGKIFKPKTDQAPPDQNEPYQAIDIIQLEYELIKLPDHGRHTNSYV